MSESKTTTPSVHGEHGIEQKSIDNCQNAIRRLTRETVNTHADERLLNFYEWQGCIDASTTTVTRLTEHAADGQEVSR